MALFSLFGKKSSQPATPEESKDAPVTETARGAYSHQNDDVMVRETGAQKAHRDLARITAEKIDAIESEIARDILKSPPAKGEKNTASTSGGVEKPAEYPSTDLFHTTLIRVDKETMILFKEDMDD